MERPFLSFEYGQLMSSSIGEVAVQHVAQVRRRTGEHVLAWARQVSNGALRYILELNVSERGEACGCVCISCGNPLTAVNAATSAFIVRPHFRHQKGAEIAHCQVLSARAALLSSLQSGELITLPLTRRAVSVTGLSGTKYTAWFELAPQQVRIGRVDFRDATSAEVLLEDGRRLLVNVTGSSLATAEDGATLLPSLVIEVDDPELAGMAPADLRSRLLPALLSGQWCGHWPSPDDERQALDEAGELARAALDFDDEHLELPPDLRRESLLHREVKSILATATSFVVPGWHIDHSGLALTLPNIQHEIVLSGARLESKLGNIIPDVIAETAEYGDLIVEVTVTNKITPERHARIRHAGLPSLEIDFSRMGGRLVRDELRSLVLNSVAGKRWLHQPIHELTEAASLTDEICFGVAWPEKKAQRIIVDQSAEDCGANYLECVGYLAKLDAVEDSERERLGQHWVQAREVAYRDVLCAADSLHQRGFPEALDYRLFDDGHTILHRVMSIARDKPVGYRYNSSWQVINTMLTDGPGARSWHSLYLIAIKVYAPTMNDSQRKRYEEWRDEVRLEVKRGQAGYLRDSKYDSLFGLLFPEMLPALSQAAAKSRVQGRTHKITRRDDAKMEWTRFADDEQRWFWTLPLAIVTQQFELAASSARLEGWSVDESSLLYHLARTRYVKHVSVFVSHICNELRLPQGLVRRYLYREGYISMSPVR